MGLLVTVETVPLLSSSRYVTANRIVRIGAVVDEALKMLC